MVAGPGRGGAGDDGRALGDPVLDLGGGARDEADGDRGQDGLAVRVEREDAVVALAAAQRRRRDRQDVRRAGDGDGTSAVIPERAFAGGSARVTVTGYETTEPELLALATGEIAETLPVTSARDGGERDRRRLADGDVPEVDSTTSVRDLEGGAVDDDRGAGRGVEPGLDVDLGHEAVDRRDP